MDWCEAKKMIAVIGDIHGSIKTLKKLYFTLLDNYLIHRIIFLGDIIDRGLHSKEVVEFLMDRQGECLMTFLKGNHEDLLINSVDNEGRYPNFSWHERVGCSTVASFMGISLEEASKKSQWEITPHFLPYMEFFRNFCEYYIEKTKKHTFLLSHAGPAFFDIPPDKQYEKCDNDQKARHYPYLWHKNTKNYKSKYFHYTLIHGHEALVDKNSTAYEYSHVEPKIYKDVDGHVISINIDTGCCYGGKLTAMIIDNDGNYTFEQVACDD